jgi:peptidylprolyl isomerase
MAAKAGDKVKVHYTGKLTDGTVFDSSDGRDPLQFTVGGGMVIKGFDQAVTGMNPGDSKSVEIPPDQAYGPHRVDLVVEIQRDQIPPDLNPEVGQQLSVQRNDGQMFPVTVINVSDEKVTLDANHALAGKALIFEIKLLEIV